jgi:hypothetical protein
VLGRPKGRPFSFFLSLSYRDPPFPDGVNVLLDKPDPRIFAARSKELRTKRFQIGLYPFALTLTE